MKVIKWLEKKTGSLEGKTVAITGSTGGIGRELCRYLLSLGASLVLVDRDRKRSDELRLVLKKEFCDAHIEQIISDMENIDSVKESCLILESMEIYALVLNAGAYSIPRHKCSTGYDNVFQINFISPYYMARRLMPYLEAVVAVGSIAHNYSKTDPDDVDFSNRKKASLVYGNAKRYLMYALHGLFESEEKACLAVTHPGISFTGITNHYPKLIFAIIKNPMKVIFMKPKTACLSILYGLFEKTEKGTWIGPRIFDIWGKPKKKALKTASVSEQQYIFEEAERIYKELEKGNDRS